MAGTDSTTLAVATREPEGSRSARRLRREGLVPGVVYGGGTDPVSFSIDARELRVALANAGAVLDLQIDGEGGTPVLVKELIRHPVSGATMHLDLLRVRLDRAIQATVTLELTGSDDAPGVKAGGVVEQQLRELTIEALPNDIPDSITHDISEMEIGDSLTLDALKAPNGVTIIGEPDVTVATVSAPRLQVEPDSEIESETEVVGEEGAAGEGASEDGGDAGSAADAGSGSDE
jgi:large subunit ribosomal protein L25